MLFITFLIFLVLSTISTYNVESTSGNITPSGSDIASGNININKDIYNIILNRLGIISILFSLIIWITSINIISITPGITLYNNWFNITSYNVPLSILTFILVIGLLIYSANNNRYDLKSLSLNLLIIANLIGLILFPLVNDLIPLYIIIELQSYSLYLITGLHNRSYNASRASLLYFLMGGIASAIILLASYFIYNLTGTTNLTDISLLNEYNLIEYNYDYFNILLIALLFKMGIAPLHRWSIAVYNYSPTYITAYISLVAKISIISFIFINSNLFNHHILIIFFYISLIIGAYKPLYQVNIKTILAYSGILNFGYILLTIITFDLSFYVYIIQYVLTHLILFLGILGASQYINKPVSTWSPLVYIHQLKLPNMTLAFCLIIALFSLIGIPPLAGFWSKYYVLSAALQDNYILESIVLVICSVFATYYYANIIKVLMTSYNSNNLSVINYINPSLAYIISLCTVLVINFFVILPSLLEGLYLITA